jgi:hypothetical protein
MEREKRNDIFKKRREGKMGWLNDYRGREGNMHKRWLTEKEKRTWFKNIPYIVECGVNIDLIRGSCPPKLSV